MGCGGTPYTYVNENEIPPGPGLLSGEDGEATLHSSKPDELEKPTASSEKNVVESQSFPNQQEFQEFQNWKKEREEFEKFQQWKKTTKGQKEYQEFKEWQRWNDYKKWLDSQTGSD